MVVLYTVMDNTIKKQNKNKTGRFVTVFLKSVFHIHVIIYMVTPV